MTPLIGTSEATGTVASRSEFELELEKKKTVGNVRWKIICAHRVFYFASISVHFVLDIKTPTVLQISTKASLNKEKVLDVCSFLFLHWFARFQCWL
jgi:hypothetical protein